MRRWPLLVLALGLGLLPYLSQATPGLLVWDYPRRVTTTGFVLTVTPLGDSPQVTSLQARTGPTCGQAQEATDEAWCATLACPGTGVYRLTVRALQGQRQSEPSNTMHLGCLQQGSLCECTAFRTDVAALPAPAEPASVPAPAPAPVAVAPEPELPPDLPPALDPVERAPAPSLTPAMLGPLGSDGPNLVLSWTYPRQEARPPIRFLISYRGEWFYSLVLYAVPLHEVDACRSVQGAGGNTWCARLACPGPGIWQFSVQADYGEDLAPASNTVGCMIPSPPSNTPVPCTCH